MSYVYNDEGEGSRTPAKYLALILDFLRRDARECTHGDQDAPWLRAQNREFRGRSARRFAAAREYCLLVISAACRNAPILA